MPARKNQPKNDLEAVSAACSFKPFVTREYALSVMLTSECPQLFRDDFRVHTLNHQFGRHRVTCGALRSMADLPGDRSSPEALYPQIPLPE